MKPLIIKSLVQAISTCLFIILISTKASTQSNTNFQQINSSTFTDDTLIGKLHYFEHIFINDTELYEQYLLYDKSRRTQKKINNICLGVMAGGVIGWLVVKEKTDFARFPKPAVGAIFAGFILSPVTLIVANTILIPQKNKRKNNLLSTYQIKQGKNLGQRLELSINNCGLSLRLSF